MSKKQQPEVQPLPPFESIQPSKTKAQRLAQWKAKYQAEIDRMVARHQNTIHMCQQSIEHDKAKIKQLRSTGMTPVCLTCDETRDLGRRAKYCHVCGTELTEVLRPASKAK